jgi:hypothetical protein
MTDKPSKTCGCCGRLFSWRKKWERDWDSVKYCSDACRRRGVRDVDEQLEAAMLRLIRSRSGGATICPSEAAREVDPNGWPSLMDQARNAARRLVRAGAAVIMQGGKAVDPDRARGPIRVRKA